MPVNESQLMKWKSERATRIVLLGCASTLDEISRRAQPYAKSYALSQGASEAVDAALGRPEDGPAPIETLMDEWTGVLVLRRVFREIVIGPNDWLEQALVGTEVENDI